jgi:hypothetical protein
MDEKRGDSDHRDDQQEVSEGGHRWRIHLGQTWVWDIKEEMWFGGLSN